MDVSPKVSGVIAGFGLFLKREGYRESTVRSAVSALKAVARRTELLDAGGVKDYLARAEMGDGRKEVVSYHLARFYEFMGLPFKRPRYCRVEKLPFIPLESEVDALIAGAGRKTATFLLLIKETGARSGEAWALKWTDIDFEAKTVTITPEKGSRARRLKISNRLVAMLTAFPREWEYVFHRPEVDSIDSFEWFRRTFLNQCKSIAKKLQNPRIDRISFKTLRHWKATQLYHKTKDILLVQRFLGHKNIKNTLVYTHLVDWESDEYVCKVAKNVDEAKALVESGFEYVTEIDNESLFRKRK